MVLVHPDAAFRDRATSLRATIGQRISELSVQRNVDNALEVDAATGLTVSELLALRWDDVDFKTLEIRVTESIRHQASASARRKPQPSPSQWTSTWLKIFVAGAGTARTRWMVTGYLPFRAGRESNPTGQTIS
jgi:integrase